MEFTEAVSNMNGLVSQYQQYHAGRLGRGTRHAFTIAWRLCLDLCRHLDRSWRQLIDKESLVAIQVQLFA